MSVCAQARSRREAAINKRLGPKTGRATLLRTTKNVLLTGGGKVSKTARKSIGKR